MMRVVKKHVSKALSFEPVRFLIIGSANTIIDFSILNLFVSGFEFDRIKANIVSTTFAMAFSFWANRTLVFRSNSSKRHNEAILFIVGTLFGLYFIQSIVIHFLTEVWTVPLDALADLLTGVDREVLFTNVAKAVATGCTLFWNFFFYKKVVFAKPSNEEVSDEKQD